MALNVYFLASNSAKYCLRNDFKNLILPLDIALAVLVLKVFSILNNFS